MKNLKIHIIPGNPGIKEYYKEFVNSLSLYCDHPDLVITVNSHYGHGDSIRTDKLYNLTEQIKYHEANLLQDENNEDDIILVGHSIGCYIIVKLLENASINARVKQVWMLFPTVERMSDSEKGKKMTPLLNMRSFHWLAYATMLLLSFLPRFIRLQIISFMLGGMVQTHHAVQGTDTFLSVNAFSQSIYMAKDEMNGVREIDTVWSSIEANWMKMRWYYGAKDHWCPVEYYHDMLARAENCQLSTQHVYLDDRDMDHAFVLKHSSEMAEICSKWLKDAVSV